MNKKREFFKLKKVNLIITFLSIAIGLIVIISIYNQHQSDKKEQAAIVLQKKEDVKIENQKQEGVAKEIEQKKLEELKVLEEKKKVEEQKALEDKKKLEEQKALAEQKKVEEQKKADEAKAVTEASAESTSEANTTNGEITKEKAIEIVSKIIINKIPKVKVEYDHIQKRNAKNYYVVRAYDDMGDHISTLGWYYVQVDTGKAFEWDLIEDTLIPIN